MLQEQGLHARGATSCSMSQGWESILCLTKSRHIASLQIRAETASAPLLVGSSSTLCAGREPLCCGQPRWLAPCHQQGARSPCCTDNARFPSGCVTWRETKIHHLRKVVLGPHRRASCKVASIPPCKHPGPLCFHLKSVLATMEAVC